MHVGIHYDAMHGCNTLASSTVTTRAPEEVNKL